DLLAPMPILVAGSDQLQHDFSEFGIQRHNVFPYSLVMLAMFRIWRPMGTAPTTASPAFQPR
ncbi:MAG TPA: hypothetical protein PKV55_08425, partial [Nitrospira sp.]|nr:hypothetical protein [Nitrospira sp.]